MGRTPKDKVSVSADDANQVEVAAALKSRRIVITRAAHQSAEMAAIIERLGGSAEFYPCIDLRPAGSTIEVDQTLTEAAAGAFDILVITSANTALMVSRHLERLGRSLDQIEVFAVGPKTVEAIEEHLDLTVTLTVKEHTAEGLVEEIPPIDGKKILLPQSAIARPFLADALRSAGASVTTVTVYQTVLGQGGADIPGLLSAGEIDAVTFTSPSTVRNFLTRIESEGGSRNDLEGVCLAAIGPVTAAAMKAEGTSVDVMPLRYTTSDLVNSLADFYKEM